MAIYLCHSGKLQLPEEPFAKLPSVVLIVLVSLKEIWQPPTSETGQAHAGTRILVLGLGLARGNGVFFCANHKSTGDRLIGTVTI